MDRPNEVNKLLQKYPSLRAYINHIEKENEEFSKQVSELIRRVEELEQAVKDATKSVRSRDLREVSRRHD